MGHMLAFVSHRSVRMGSFSSHLLCSNQIHINMGAHLYGLCGMGQIHGDANNITTNTGAAQISLAVVTIAEMILITAMAALPLPYNKLRLACRWPVRLARTTLCCRPSIEAGHLSRSSSSSPITTISKKKNERR